MVLKGVAMAKQDKAQANFDVKKETKRITARVDISRKNSNTKVFILQLSKSAEKALSMKPSQNTNKSKKTVRKKTAAHA